MSLWRPPSGRRVLPFGDAREPIHGGLGCDNRLTAMDGGNAGFAGAKTCQGSHTLLKSAHATRWASAFLRHYALYPLSARSSLVLLAVSEDFGSSGTASDASQRRSVTLIPEAGCH